MDGANGRTSDGDGTGPEKKKLTQEMAMETAKRRVRGGVFGDFSLAFSRI